MLWTIVFLILGVSLISMGAIFTAKEYIAYWRSRPNTAIQLATKNAEGVYEVTVPEVFDERRIQSDLMKLAGSPGAIGKYLAQAQIRFTQARQIKVLNRYTEFYKAGEEVLRARTQMARASNELRQVDLESEVNAVEKDARIADFEAQRAESLLRKKQAESKAKEFEPRSTENLPRGKEEKRLQRKREIEETIARLRKEKKECLAQLDEGDEDSIRRMANLYDDRIVDEENELRKYL